MDIVLSELEALGFQRVARVNRGALVVHCVPGAGKSSLIRKLLSRSTIFTAYTFGVADPVNLLGRRILPAKEYRGQGTSDFVIVDEYTEGDWEALNPRVIFGDPCQTRTGNNCLIADFVCFKTHRFGKATCTLLQSLGFTIESDFEDEVEIVSAVGSEVVGELLVCDCEAAAFAEFHRADFKRVEDVRGSTYPEVTFLTSYECIPDHLRADFYLCLTRHQRKLRVLTPDAVFGPSR
ncbi:TGB1 [Rose virus A]|uniref:TGB1 n=1 Tax=Rose virus A TaxID=2650000 RepID=A0AAE6NQ67_9VIRU|nr:TGB1 [Rose virus A]QEV82105.1 TGB1 [Rose virus A]